jgi:hypothetical protein
VHTSKRDVVFLRILSSDYHVKVGNGLNHRDAFRPVSFVFI